MHIKVNEWQVSPYKKGKGYQVSRRVGDTDRYKAYGWYFNHVDAVNAVYEQLVLESPTTAIIDSNDIAETRDEVAQLIQKLEAIADGLVDEVRNAR